MKKLIVFFTTAVLFTPAGCAVVGLIANPTRHEKKITAEYDIARYRNAKILVFVDQPAWLNAGANLRYHLTKAINEFLETKAEIPIENLVRYSDLAEFRSGTTGFSLLGPLDVGGAMKVDIVLFVAIDGYEMKQIAQTGYYKGALSAKAVLFDVAAEKKLWPESDSGKRIKVAFDIESEGQEVALSRLARAYAHCNTRYFYGCPSDEFKIADDRTSLDWDNLNDREAFGDLQ